MNPTYAPTATEFPLCMARKILDCLPVGAKNAAYYPRVNMSRMFQSFNQHERAKWDRLSITIERDDRGMMPAQIEQFLSTLPPCEESLEATGNAAQPLEAMKMTTAVAKKPRKKAAKKQTAKGAAGKSVGMTPKVKAAARKAAKKMDDNLKEAGLTATVSANGKSATFGATNGDTTKNDPAQPPLPGMEEERVPSIERAIKKVLDKRAEAKACKEAADLELGRLPGLLHKHDLQTYKCLGRVVVIEPGADVVKIKKIKDK